MSDYILDWKASHLDGDNTLNGVDGNIGVHIATPENADWDSWGIGEVGGQHDQLIANCVNDPTVVTATFDAPIENVTFELLDVDSDNCNWDDRVTIIAKDAHGNIVPVQFSDLEAHHHVNGGVLNTTGDSGENNVTVTIPGPIVSLEIILDNGAGAEYSGKVGVGDLHFDLAGGAQDGYVDGTAGDDVIDAGYDNDPDGDKIDSNDALLPGEAPQDDVVLAGAGDDLVLAGDGNDEVYGGTGDDTLCGQDGDDVMYGGQGADRLEGMRGNDLLFGQAGNDVITGDQGNDVLVGDAGDDALFGGSGKDVAHGGTGDDTLAMGSGNDVAYGGAGADTISGGDGDDTLIGGGRSFNGTLDFNDLSKGDLVNGQYLGQGVHISSADPHNPVMIFDSANPTGGDHDLETNNLGNVLILSEDRDGADPDDNASGGTFVFEFDGPAFVDNIRMLDMEQAGEIRLYDVDGNLFKTITTGTSGDNGQFTQIICEHGVLRMEIDLNGSGALDNLSYVLDGTADDAGDVIDGGAGDDYIAGQAGDDVLTGGAGADEIFGGDDADLIIGGNDGDVVDGGTGGNDNDTLDLTDQGPLRVINQTQDADGNSTSGTIEFLDADGNVTGSMDFFEIENLLLPENTGPDAVDDSASTQEDTAVTIPVLGNDSDPEGDTLTVTEATSPDGDVVINPDGTITFTPNPDFNGDAEITYTITDGNGNEDTATVTVTVSPVNDDPDAVDDTASTDEDSPVTIDVLGNDSDVDGDPLTVTEATSPDGDVTINPDGTITFTPNPDFTGEAIITYTVDDGNGGTDTAIVTVTVGAVNDDPDAVDSTYVVSQNETDGDTDGNAITDDTGAGKDSDPDGDTLTVAKVGGAVAGVGAVVAGSNGGLFTIGENGAIDFDANGEFDALADGETAETTVSYTISDGNGGTDTANVTFIVQGTNDGPVATDNAYIVDRSEAAGDVDGNVITDDTGDGVDSDPEGQDLSVIAVNGSTGNVSNAVTGDNGGSFVINPDGTVDFIAGDDFDDLGLGESVTTSVTYTISDGNGGTDTGVASFTVTGTNDGTVEGTSGADLIDVDYLGDPDGDRVDNNDAILPGDKGDDDLIFGYEGDDSIIAGNGDDEVYGGIGDDQISSGTGNDTVFGDDGNDVIDTSNPNADALPDVGYPGLYPADTDPNNDLDTAFGGAGDDTIFTGDDNDIIFGGSGNDTIDAGWDDDTVRGEDGNDTILGNEGNDEIYGGAGDDLIYGGLDNSVPDAINIPDDGSGPFGADLVPENNGDTIFGGDGNDTIFGKDDDDTLFGGNGNDVIDGGVDDDLIDGGDGDDTLLGGQGDDSILGGDGDDVIEGGDGDDVLAGGFGSDLFIGGNGGDAVVGGEDPDGKDVDVLDLTGSNVDFITYNDADPESGVVTFLDGTTMTFSEIENVIPCFTPGTTIATPKGERLVEDLKVGDRVITRDNGIQEIAWVGHKQMNGTTLAKNPHLKPIMIKAGSLGQGLPERDMMVSPNHRVLVASELTQLYFEEREVLAAAKHMTGAEGVHTLNVMSTTYIHFMFEAHEVVLSNGAWTESFQPGDYSLKGLGNSQRNEIFELFPELATRTGLEGYQSARRALKKHEAQLLLK